MRINRLCEIAIDAALAAGNVIRQHMNQDILVEKKEGLRSFASQVVTEVDRACEKVILSILLPTCEELDLAILSEETEDDKGRFLKEYFWCIDPMDGTLPFIKQQLGFSVSIALVARDGRPHIGVVFDPNSGNLYHAIDGKGAYKNRQAWVIDNKNDYLTYVTDHTLNNTPRAQEIEKLLHDKAEDLKLNGVREIAGAGSVMNAIRVLENGPALMMKFAKEQQGGGSIWDFAATACIYQELGLPATNMQGGNLDLNKKDGTFMNHEGVYYANLKRGSGFGV